MNKTIIIALPFAGGNKYSYRALEKYVSNDIDWVSLDLPGRGERFNEPILETIDEMVKDLLLQIKPLIRQNNYIFYGHSLGTVLGYELTKHIIKQNLRLPICLFFTGRGSPRQEKFLEKKSQLPKDLFWKDVNKIGGLPKEILANEDLLDLYYPIVKSDFKAIEDYICSETGVPFSIPISVCLGTEEIGNDKDKTSLAAMKAWADDTTSTCEFELFSGDHFFIFKHPKAIVQKICDAIEKNSTNVNL